MSTREVREWGTALLAAMALAASAGGWIFDRSGLVRERLAALEAKIALMQEQLNRIEGRLSQSRGDR